MKTESEPTPQTPRNCDPLLESSAPKESSGRVLIVEDEAELAELLEFNLRRQGYSTDIAHDGLSACRLIGKERPELILLDLMLPDLDGWEICRMVRSHPDPQMAQVPIIMLTAMGTLNDRVRGIELGADIYLSKPYSIREVLLHVRQLITRNRRQRQMEQQLDQLQASMSQEKRWQEMLFHELRNQLLVISGYSFRLEARSQDLTLQTSREYLQAINRSSNYLNELAEEFMMIRQLEFEACSLPREPVSLQWLVEEIVELFRPHAGSQNKILEWHSPDLAAQHLNQTALKLILSNLVENAIKYSGTGERIAVHLAKTAAGLEIRVEDEGPGIPAEDLERIFGKFYRSPKLAEKLTGTGLGLYTAGTLAGAMGGTITAHNRPQGGACFVLSLPV